MLFLDWINKAKAQHSIADLPVTLNAKVRAFCAVRSTKMVAEITAIPFSKTSFLKLRARFKFVLMYLPTDGPFSRPTGADGT